MATPSDNLFIADLPVGFTEEQLRSVMGAYGTIQQCKVLAGTDPSRKVAALVRFGSVDEAKWIVENLNGNMPQGLSEPIICRYHEPKGAAAGGCGGGWDAWGKGGGKDAWGGPYGNMGMAKGKGKGKISVKLLVKGLKDAGALPGSNEVQDDNNTLYLAGLPDDTTDADLYRIFSPFGPVSPLGCRAVLNKDTFACSGIGFVNFMDPATAQTAVATLNGTMMPNGTFLTVKVKADQPNKKPAGM